MTSGTIVEDHRGTEYIPHNTYYDRHWEGGNDPVTHKRPNNFVLTIWTWKRDCVSMKNPYWPPTPAYFYAGTNYDVNTATILGTPVDGNTVLKALSKLKADIQCHDFNAAGAFADFEKTLEMLLGSVKSCFNMLKAIQRLDLAEILRLIPEIVKGNRKKQRDLTKAVRGGDIASVWLAVQYGWKPLVSDVSEALDAFKGRRETLFNTTFKERATSELRKINVYVDTTCPVWAWLRERVQYVLYLTEVPGKLSLLGLTDWATVIWERIPFSFVADWFIPIGEAFEEAQFFAGLKYTFCKTESQVWSVDQPTYGSDARWAPGRLWFRGVVIRRNVGTSIGFTMPSFKSFEKALSRTHLQNAAALLAGEVDEFNQLEERAGRRPPRNRLGPQKKWRGSLY